MPLKGTDLLAAGRVPEKGKLVIPPGEREAAVRAERHRCDTVGPFGVALQGTDLPAAGDVPQNGHVARRAFVFRAGEQLAAVRTERQGADPGVETSLKITNLL